VASSIEKSSERMGYLSLIALAAGVMPVLIRKEVVLEVEEGLANCFWRFSVDHLSNMLAVNVK
jgi:hypothetical protein